MKRFIIKFLIVILAVVCSIQGFAADYGTNTSSCDIRYFVTSGVVNVYPSNSAKHKAVRTIKAGDYVYVDSDTLYYNGEEAWVKVSGANEYILSCLLTIEDNPKYVAEVNDNMLETKTSLLRLGFYNIPKWLGITMLSVWGLLALFFCIAMVLDSKLKLRWCPPNKKPVFLENPDAEYGYGQSKVLFFSPAPYKLFSNVALIFLLTFVATIILFIVVGGLVWVCTWIGRILITILFWVFVIGLPILSGYLILRGAFDSFDDWDEWYVRVLMVGACWIPIVLTVKLARLKVDIFYWAETMVDWGSAVFTTFNIFNVALYTIKTYWLTALIISVAPLALFLCAAILFMLFAGAMRLYENIKMKRYNVSHPCPFCGEHSEPAVYLSNGIPLHVPLRPSVWGMFNITHPATGEKMPTLFLRGKDSLERRCVHCDNLISAHIGAEKHIAVAGVPNSGKSTLLYRIISELCRMKVGDENICSFTDNMGSNEISVKSFLDSIGNGQKMEYFPDKTSEGRHKSIQLLAQNPNGTLPYRLYVNDIAGEMFTATNNQYQDAPFFKNTNVLIFALDPFTMKANELDFSPEFASWYKANVGDKNDCEGKVDLDEAFSALVNTIIKYRKEKEFSKIKLMITYVKTDTGYLKGLGDKNDSALLREFAVSEMGLEGLVSKLEAKGFDISYHSISASDDVKKSGISTYIDCILDNLGISFRNLSEKQLADRKVKMLQHDMQFKSADRYKAIENPNVINNNRQILSVVASFIIGALLIIGAAKMSTKAHDRNYNKAIQLVDKASSKAMYYDEVMSIVKTSLAEKSLSETQKEELTNVYMSADREKRKHISKLRSILYANFEAKKGRLSNFELSLKYKTADFKKFQQYLEELQTLAPEDALYLKYRDMFDKLLLKYKVSK